MIIFPIYFILLGLIVRFYWRRAKRRNPQLKFRYSIIEIWCAIVGLTPTFVFIGYLGRLGEHALEAWPLALAMFLSQVAGMFIMKVDVHEDNPHYEPAHSVLAGAFMGLLIPFILGLMAFPFLLLFGAVAINWSPGVAFLGVAGVLLVVAVWRNARAK